MTDREASSTPFALPPGARIWVGGHDRAARRALEAVVAGAPRPPTGPIDAAFVAPETLDEAAYFVDKVLPRLVPSGVIWIVTSTTGGTTIDHDALHDMMANRNLCERTRTCLADAVQCFAFER